MPLNPAFLRHGLPALSLCAAVVLGAAGASGRAQAGRAQFSPDFTRDEFAGRRARIADAIGPKSIALLQGAPSVHSSAIFRQSNEFFYVTGVIVRRPTCSWTARPSAARSTCRTVMSGGLQPKGIS